MAQYIKPASAVHALTERQGYEEYQVSRRLGQHPAPYMIKDQSLLPLWYQGQAVAAMMEKMLGDAPRWPGSNKADRKLFQQAYAMAMLHIVNGSEPGEDE